MLKSSTFGFDFKLFLVRSVLLGKLSGFGRLVKPASFLQRLGRELVHTMHSINIYSLYQFICI